jgi:transcriptional regulator with XRE-family HTH domain
MRVSSIGEYIKEQREQAKISLRQLAAAAGVSNPYLSQIERGLRRPSAEILQQIAKGLRISAEALYVQAGILEDRPTHSGVRAAVLAEPVLTERQKQVLLEIYDSFRKEAAAQAETAAQAGSTADVAAAQAAGTPAAATATADATAAAAAAGNGRAADVPAAGQGRAREAAGDEEDDDPLAAAVPVSADDTAPHAQAPAPESGTLPTNRADQDLPDQADQEG